VGIDHNLLALATVVTYHTVLNRAIDCDNIYLVINILENIHNMCILKISKQFHPFPFPLPPP